MDDDLEENPRAAAAEEESDNEGESEVVDYTFLSLLQKKDCVIPARGIKDFEPDGTNKQTQILQRSRDAMYTALAVERDLSVRNYIRAIWNSEKALGQVQAADTKGSMFKSIGRTDRDGITWLLPEELLYMVERGSLECFYKDVEISMSLQAVYAECMPHIGVDHFQVYAYLKRAGYMVLRSGQGPSCLAMQSNDLSLLRVRWSSALLRLSHTLSGASRTKGMLDRSKVYRSFQDVYASLSIVPCHQVSDTNAKSRVADPGTQESLSLSYDIWKPNTHFRKSDPGPPHFQIAVLNSRAHGLCSLKTLDRLFQTLSDDASYDRMSQFTKLKVGKRHLILAIADMGVISFMSLGDVSFGSEPVYVPWQSINPKPRQFIQRHLPK